MKSQGIARVCAPKVPFAAPRGFKRLNLAVGSRACIVGAHQPHNRADEKSATLAAWGAHVRAPAQKQQTAALRV
jgi:hypothetical protein